MTELWQEAWERMLEQGILGTGQEQETLEMVVEQEALATVLEQQV